MFNYQIYISFYTILRKEVNRFFRIWTQTLLPPVITQTLYFVIFGGFIGSRIQGFEEEFGISYMAFIVPGLVMMAVITASFSNVVSSFFGAKFQKNIEELLVSPTPNWVIIAGFVGGGVLRGLIVGLIVFLVSLTFVNDLRVDNPLLVLIFVFLTAIVFSLAGFLNSIFATKFDDISIFTTFILTPLTYLGGVFYSISSLPPFWQQISKANPILYMINGFRFGFYGQSDVSVWASFAILLVLTLGLWQLNCYLLKKGVGMRG
jgi:ABC-2 type transport system permease protein